MSRSPFPGMDPYLESPALWPDVHSSLMNIIREQLAPRLAPKYIAELDTQIVIDRLWDEAGNYQFVMPDVSVAAIGEAVAIYRTEVTEELPKVTFTDFVVAPSVPPPPLWLRVPPAVSVRLTTLHVRRQKDKKLVAVIELLSPINKRPGDGRRAYLEKRMGFLESPVHFIEIDLLRRWPRMPLEGQLPQCDYLAIVRNFYERDRVGVWPISLRQPLPVLPVPLLRPDPDVPLDLGQALRTAYERARYDLRIDYRFVADLTGL